MDEKVMYVARDENGALFMFDNRPEKRSAKWLPSEGALFSIDDTLFPSVQWSDPEPTKVLISILHKDER